MKKVFTTFSLIFVLLISGNVFAQDTIAAWTFPASSPDSLIDKGIPINSSRYLSCEFGEWGTPSYYELDIDYSADGSMGAPDKCAQVSGTENGADSLYWMVKFKTEGYENLKLYSKQSSDANNPGPKDFKLQYKISGTSIYTDLPNGAIVIGNDWTTGVVDAYVLPPECENLSGNVTIRWMQTSNLDVNGNPLVASGITRLDDIVITGEQMVGLNEIKGIDNISVYPNPSEGSFIIENIENAREIIIYNLIGKCIDNVQQPKGNSIYFNGYNEGIYFIQIINNDNSAITKRIVVK